jgi:hypothetical protein
VPGVRVNTTESTDLNLLLDHMLTQLHTTAVPPNIRNAACRLADRAHARISAGLTSADVHQAWPDPDTAVPFVGPDGPIPGYVAGHCGHRVAASEWRAGFRTCERCPAPAEATPDAVKLAPATMTVTIRDRSAEAPWGSGPTRPVTRRVTISAHCPVCEGRRGEPRGLNQCDDGERYWVQVWDNPCGHVDRYENVVRERAELVAQAWSVLRHAAGRADDPDAVFTAPEELYEQAVQQAGDDTTRERIAQAARVLWPDKTVTSDE